MPKVLIVDDSPIVRELVAGVLRADGMEVIVADTPLGVAALVAQQRPDLVLMDMQMPALSGERSVELLASNGLLRDTRVVFFSDRPEAELARAARSSGAEGYLRKGGDSDVWLQRIKTWLAQPPRAYRHESAARSRA